jgi:CheY-like chemotaxis protein
MDGLTAVRQLRKEEKEQGLKRNLVIALTGNAREQQIQNALDSGMDAVVRALPFPRC